MGWTCQHDHKGSCIRVQKPCVPGMKGCTLQNSGYTFSTGSYEQDKNNKEQKTRQIDFAELAKSH